MQELTKQRELISQIDEKIIELLGKRKEIVKEIKKIKDGMQAGIEDKKREQEMKETRNKLLKENNLTSKEVEPVFTEILNWSKQIQKNS